MPGPQGSSGLRTDSGTPPGRLAASLHITPSDPRVMGVGGMACSGDLAILFNRFLIKHRNAAYERSRVRNCFQEAGQLGAGEPIGPWVMGLGVSRPLPGLWRWDQPIVAYALSLSPISICTVALLTGCNVSLLAHIDPLRQRHVAPGLAHAEACGQLIPTALMTPSQQRLA